MIIKWIQLALTPVQRVQSNAPSSYGLKHYCENAIGEYVSNQEMIDCMNELGFESKRHGSNSPNYDYNISKVINKVKFNNPKRISTYNFDGRYFHHKAKEIIVDM